MIKWIVREMHFHKLNIGRIIIAIASAAHTSDAELIPAYIIAGIGDRGMIKDSFAVGIGLVNLPYITGCYPSSEIREVKVAMVHVKISQNGGGECKKRGNG